MGWKEKFPRFFEKTLSIKLKKWDLEIYNKSKEYPHGDPVANNAMEPMKRKAALKKQTQEPHVSSNNNKRVI